MNIEHIALNVPDPTAMAQWYVRHLGMRVVRRPEGPTHTHFVADPAGRVVLELYRQTKAPIPDYASMDPMVLHVAFAADQVAQERRKLLEAGATPVGEVVTSETGDELAMVRDPWGLAVQIVKRARRLME
jgi:catechol 2,3-dioxygenase-like lactoylglutathione lyase family enzyme